MLFITFGAIIYFYANKLSVEINEKWGSRYVSQQLAFDKQKTLLPIMNEVALVKRLSQERSIIDMALNESDKEIYKKGLQTLDEYRLKFHNKTYFAAFCKSNSYFYNNSNNDYKNIELVCTLDKNNKNDNWFFNTINQEKNFNINIDRDANTKATNIWINYQIKYNSKVIGVIGTGFELNQFLKNFVKTSQSGIYNIFINDNLEIQLEQSSKFMDYENISKLKKKCTTISTYITDSNELQKLKNTLLELKNSKIKDDNKTLWLRLNNQEHLVGVSYIKELGWYNITAVDSILLSTINAYDITPIFIILLVLLLIVIGLFLRFYILNPIKTIKYQMEDIEKNGYKDEIIIVKGSDEISQLSKQFQHLLLRIRKHESLLEQTVQERTDELYKKQQYLNTILDNVDAYIFIKDLNFRYVYVNKAMQDVMCEPIENILNQDISTLYDEETQKKIKDLDRQTLELGEKTVSEEMIHKTGLESIYVLVKKVPLYDTKGNIYGLLGISTDITSRKKYESIISQMAYYDILTKLPNRRLLEDRLSIMLGETKRNKTYGALMFLDMDNFKNINDTYGHKIGDMLLEKASNRLISSIRDIDTVARFGGDEFVVAIGGLNADKIMAQKEAVEVANKILKITNKIYLINSDTKELELESTFSIGLTLFNSLDNSIDVILQRADQAMYKVKNSNKNGVAIL